MKVKTTVEGVTVDREGTEYVVTDIETGRKLGRVQKEDSYKSGRAGSGRWFANYVRRDGQSLPTWARGFSRETTLTRAIEFLVMCDKA
jgi:hypothetical protein